MHLHRFVLRNLKSHSRQRLEERALLFLEERHRRNTGRAVFGRTVFFPAPAKRFLVQLLQSPGGMGRLQATEQLSRIRNQPFDFRLVGRLGDPRGVDKGTIILCKLRVRSIDLRIPDVWLQDARFQIINEQAIRRPVVELDHSDVALDE